MKGRPRKPLELLKLNGATKKNPKRYAERQKEQRDDRDIGPPPEEFLNPHSSKAIAQLRIWHRFIEIAPPNCIKRRHWMTLKNACILQEKIDHGGKVTSSDHAQMLRYLTSFGMSGESRLPGEAKGTPPPGESEESGWEAFAREEKAPRVG